MTKARQSFGSNIESLFDGGVLGFFKGRLADLKDVERRVETLYDKGQVQQSDIDILRYYRLEAEEALAIEKAQGERVKGE